MRVAAVAVEDNIAILGDTSSERGNQVQKEWRRRVSLAVAAQQQECRWKTAGSSGGAIGVAPRGLING